MQLVSRQKTLDLSQPRVMGILNTTPDSFSDGGRYSHFEHACQHAEQMIAAGADIIDIGGESTRPGAAEVSLQEELDRVIPLVEYIHARHEVWISIDTSKAQVMAQGVKAGADLINDVRALQEPGALTTAAALGVPVCLMHMQGQPRTMQEQPQYNDVIADVTQFFAERIQSCIDASIPRSHIILDPGFGFGKSLAHNYELLHRLAEFKHFELPLLIGLSRKSMIGQLLSANVEQRLAGSLAAGMLSLQRGAHILRVHDVKETMDMIAVMQAMEHYKTL